MKTAFRALCLLVALLPGPAGATSETRIEVQALFKNRAMLLIDGKRRMLRAGETSPEGVTLISASARGARVEMAGQQRELKLGNRIGSSFAGPREQQVRVVADAQGMYLASGSINGVPVRFLLDTGATLISINQPLAERLGLDYRRGTASQSITASGMAPIWRLRIARVKLGDIELTEVDAAVHQGDFPPMPLLGNSFLSRVEMVRSGSSVLLRRKF